MQATQTNIKPFGISSAGEQVSVITLDNGVISCRILTFGATLQSLLVSDRSGVQRDIVLGYDTLQEYETRDGYLGSTVGRFANRISKGRFVLNGNTYTLATNDGENHLHGGMRGFSHRNWSIAETQADKVTLLLLSEDGDEGYPGNMSIRVTYALIGSSLNIHYEATSDADTICSLTNHSYFNLAGHDSGEATSQAIMINAKNYTPNSADNIPLGCITPVENTPMDLRGFIPIGTHMDSEFEQIKQAHGYDHNYAIDGAWGELHHAASAYSEETGIVMRVDTTLPGMQLYTANVLSNRAGKKGSVYDLHHAYCMETQFFPDAPNQSTFASPLLKAGETFDHTTVFTFSLNHPKTAE